MKILITGAKGFLGSAFVNELAKAGKHEIIALVKDAGPNSNTVKYISADLSNSSFTDNIPGTADCVIYLAQSNHYRNFPSGASDMFAVNTAAVASLLDWSSKNGVKKFIYASTGNVYEPRQELLKRNSLNQTKFFLCGIEAQCRIARAILFRNFRYNCFKSIFTIRYGQHGMMIPHHSKNIPLRPNCSGLKCRHLSYTIVYCQTLLNVDFNKLTTCFVWDLQF